jgi:hypothetical protein
MLADAPLAVTIAGVIVIAAPPAKIAQDEKF